MVLTPGTRFGVYDVSAQIGEGGMGQVFRATDTKLKRQVAIKMLPPSVGADPDRVARFQREAEVLASLNHPHIAGIYGLEEREGVFALVMELVDGEDLSQRLARGPIPLDEALSIAKQIADALEAAHEQGIIHRDLKPANIKVRADGTVKVLDFGLAKAVDPTSPLNADAMNSPTLTARATQLGVILGTAAYMAPEQVRGKPADRRADIWAFGAVLYELLTARRAFGGAEVSDTLAAVLRDEPDWTALPRDTPAGVRRLLTRCLKKDPTDRLQAIGDARVEIKEAIAGATETPLVSHVPPPRRWREVLAWSILAAATLFAGVAIGWWLKPSAAESHVVARFRELLPADRELVGSRHVIAIDSDGGRIAYVANRQIYFREMNALDARPISGTTEEVTPLDPVFSPDGNSIAYFVRVSDTSQPYRIRRIAVTGGAPVELSSIAGPPFGAVWRNGMIAFGMNESSECGIYAIPDTGGEKRPLVTANCQTERAVQPDLLPDGQHIIFAVPLPGATTRLTTTGEGPIVVDVIGGGHRKVLIQSGANPRVLPSGQLAYLHNRSIWAVPFDVDRLKAAADAPVQLVEDVAQTGASSAGQFAVSANGSLVYVAGNLVDTLRRLVWVDRKGGEQPLAAAPNTFQQPRLSPNGAQVAVSADANIWVWSLTSDTLTAVGTDQSAVQFNPTWAPDGRSLLFDSNVGRGIEIVRRSADGIGKSEVVVPAPGGYPDIVTPDGRLVYHTLGRLAMVVPLDRRESPRPLLDVKAHVQASDVEISPGSHQWLAYESNESGRFEVYVRPWPDVEVHRWQVSSNGGQHPLWSRDGRELFFISASGMMMSATITPGTTFTCEKPVELFSAAPYYVNVARDYDVSPDGLRFIMVKTADTKTSKPPIVFVTNWFDEVKKRMGKR